MNAPQIIIIVLYTLSLGVNIAKHGERTEYNAVSSLIAYAIIFGLLIWGGFFK